MDGCLQAPKQAWHSNEAHTGWNVKDTFDRVH